jgi:hypothetical protein
VHGCGYVGIDIRERGLVPAEVIEKYKAAGA